MQDKDARLQVVNSTDCEPLKWVASVTLGQKDNLTIGTFSGHSRLIQVLFFCFNYIL